MRIGRPVLTAAVVVASVTALSPRASAHVEPGPKAAEAGTRAIIGFVVEHGCDGSPTVRVRFQLPESVTDPQPEAPAGWTGSVSGREVTFEGGPLAADVEGVFGLVVTLPAQPGTIYFPFVQTCEQGELAWTAIPEAGAPEPENPAPALLVTDGPPTPEELEGTADPVPAPEPAPVTTAAAPATTGATTTSAAEATTTPTTVPGTTTAAPTTTTEPNGEAAPRPSDDDGSPVGLIIAGSVFVAAIASGGVLLARRRR